MYLFIKITETTFYSKSYVYKTIPSASVFQMISIVVESSQFSIIDLPVITIATIHTVSHPQMHPNALEEVFDKCAGINCWRKIFAEFRKVLGPH